jgi:hypothetical protein
MQNIEITLNLKHLKKSISYKAVWGTEVVMVYIVNKVLIHLFIDI